MNKTVKLISILLTVVMLVMMSSTVVMASNGEANVNTLLGNLRPDYNDGNSGIGTIGKQIINVISVVGVVVAVIVLLVIGIKYMMGSASEKAEYKKTMIPYLVGAILVFGASAIAGVVVNMARTIA